jgi:uncharacterized protein
MAAAAVAWHATRWAPYQPILRERTLRVPGTWPALDILHLSDLHLRRSDATLFRAQAKALGQLTRQPDLVCVTGDLCEQVADAPLVVNLLRQLQPRLGTYAILGNHEYGAGAPRACQARRPLLEHVLATICRPVLSSGLAEGEAIASTLADLGLRVLRNEGTRLVVGDRSVWLGGVDSHWAGQAKVGQALLGRRATDGTLVLVHEPELALPAMSHGADVVLAGHTHGGQIALPLVGPPCWHQRDERLTVPCGVQVFGSAQLHISAGLGQLMPVRFGCLPELVWLRCVPSADTPMI